MNTQMLYTKKIPIREDYFQKMIGREFLLVVMSKAAESRLRKRMQRIKESRNPLSVLERKISDVCSRILHRNRAEAIDYPEGTLIEIFSRGHHQLEGYIISDVDRVRYADGSPADISPEYIFTLRELKPDDGLVLTGDIRRHDPCNDAVVRPLEQIVHIHLKKQPEYKAKINIIY